MDKKATLIYKIIGITKFIMAFFVLHLVSISSKFFTNEKTIVIFNFSCIIIAIILMISGLKHFKNYYSGQEKFNFKKNKLILIVTSILSFFITLIVYYYIFLN